MRRVERAASGANLQMETMAKPPTTRASTQKQSTRRQGSMADDISRRYPPRPPSTAPEVVEPKWLIKALAITVAAGLVLAYLAICLLVWQGSWQLVLHPSAKVDQTPQSAGLTFEAISFDAGETGSPRLTGWWIAGEAAPGASPVTLLFLHDGQGSLSDSVDQLAVLHQTGANLFAIDYRGFGKSAGPHPNETRMREDTRAALVYLRDTRHVPASTIVPYGTGIGASLAAGLTAEAGASQAALPAVIVDNPEVDVIAHAFQGQTSRLLPLHLLMRDSFEIAPTLRTLQTPKLLISGGPAQVRQKDDTAAVAMYRAARDPKFLLALPPATTPPAAGHIPGGRTAEETAYVEGVRRFLDEYALAKH